jgi:gliding motility-associated-like protein
MTISSKKFFATLVDAKNDTNEISTPASYTAPTGVAFVKVYNSAGCYAIGKITLKVIPPKPSAVLQDKVICAETTTALDAGIGYTSYLWSTGATTQSISNVGVGMYWVKLKSGNCTTLQNVKVLPAELPIVTSVEIGNRELKVFVEGGQPPYKYSLDKMFWQDSNVFANLTRGVYTVYLKDSRSCNPISVEVTLPNIVNIITANNDGKNDVVDYSALSSKDNLQFVVFDKFGSRVFVADKFTNYKWDGTIFGKKLPTDTYWFTLTWNEKDKNKTPFKYSGWILLKNR